jgi:hypothetical protein
MHVGVDILSRHPNYLVLTKKQCITAQEIKKMVDYDEIINHKSTVFATFKESSIMSSRAQHVKRNQQQSTFSSILRQQGYGTTASKKV